MAVQTWGVDQTHFSSYLPQIEVDDGSGVSPVTATTLAEMIEGAAAEVNAAIVSTWGSGAVVTIAADTASDAYRNCQMLTVTLARPEVIRAAHHLLEGDALDRLDERADSVRKQLYKDASRLIAYDPSTAPGVDTSTAGLGLDTSTASVQRERRIFDGRAGGRDEKGWVY